MKQWLDFWEKCKGKKGSPVLIGLLVGLLLLVITWPDNSSKKQNTQTKTNAPAVENNVRNTEDLAQERTQRMEQRLEEVLRERELKALFAKHALFSPEDSRGISAMCSVNRLLLREKRFDELQKVSDDPEALEKLFLDFREKGFL